MDKTLLTAALTYIDSWLTYRQPRGDVPGVSVAVAYKGEVLLDSSYGYADLESKTALTPQHRFRIASHSKTFTATALMQLKEQGKLRLDDTVVTHLPWLNDHKDKRSKTVTIRQVMSHGAGIIRDGLDSDFWQLEREFPNADELKTELLQTDLVLDNNVKLKYSNFGYGLLGMVIEAASGVPYNDYVRESIVNKLGLSNMGPDYDLADTAPFVTGYTIRTLEGERLPIDHIPTNALASATGFYSTASDLARYFSAHLNGDSSLLSEDSKKEMRHIQFPVIDWFGDSYSQYGLGLDIETYKGKQMYGHGGGFPGHITKSFFIPDSDLVVVVLVNCLAAPSYMIAKSIVRIIAMFQEKRGDNADTLKRFEGRFTNLWGTEDLLVIGKTILGTNPNTWQAMTFPETLEYVDDSTLKITKTGSTSNEGELVHVTFEGDKVVKIKGGGSTMVPNDEYEARAAKRGRVSLPKRSVA